MKRYRKGHRWKVECTENDMWNLAQCQPWSGAQNPEFWISRAMPDNKPFLVKKYRFRIFKKISIRKLGWRSNCFSTFLSFLGFLGRSDFFSRTREICILPDCILQRSARGLRRRWADPHLGKRWSIAIAATDVEEAEFNHSKEDILDRVSLNIPSFSGIRKGITWNNQVI